MPLLQLERAAVCECDAVTQPNVKIFEATTTTTMSSMDAAILLLIACIPRDVKC